MPGVVQLFYGSVLITYIFHFIIKLNRARKQSYTGYAYQHLPARLRKPDFIETITVKGYIKRTILLIFTTTPNQLFRLDESMNVFS